MYTYIHIYIHTYTYIYITAIRHVPAVPNAVGGAPAARRRQRQRRRHRLLYKLHLVTTYTTQPNHQPNIYIYIAPSSCAQGGGRSASSAGAAAAQSV